VPDILFDQVKKAYINSHGTGNYKVINQIHQQQQISFFDKKFLTLHQFFLLSIKKK
jgi:hypothetical protein